MPGCLADVRREMAVVQSGRDESRAVLERELLSLVDRPDWGTLCIHIKGRLLKLPSHYRSLSVTIHSSHYSIQLSIFSCSANFYHLPKFDDFRGTIRMEFQPPRD